MDSLPMKENKTNAFPNSLMDSTMSPKVKTSEGEGVGMCSSTFKHVGGRKACWSSKMG
jgi:hypothetical protein